MNQLLILDTASNQALKEAGPLIIALGFIIALGGITAAAIIICGWGHIRSTSINWSKWSAEIVCR